MRSCLTDVGKLDRANPMEGSGRKPETSVALANRMVSKVHHLVLNGAKADVVSRVVVPQISLVRKWASRAEPLRDSQMVNKVVNQMDSGNKVDVVADETHGLLRRSRLLMQIKTA